MAECHVRGAVEEVQGFFIKREHGKHGVDMEGRTLRRDELRLRANQSAVANRKVPAADSGRTETFLEGFEQTRTRNGKEDALEDVLAKSIPKSHGKTG